MPSIPATTVPGQATKGHTYVHLWFQPEKQPKLNKIGQPVEVLSSICVAPSLKGCEHHPTS
jgi:hypothetical protein